MLYFTRWKALAIILTALVVCLCAVPNFFPEATVKGWPAWAQRRLVLGLDLQGGSYLLLEVDSNYVKKEKLDQVRDDVRRVLREAKIGYTGLATRPDSAEVRVKDTDLQNALAKLRELSQPLGGLLGSSGQRSLEVSDAGGGLIRLTVPPAAITARVRQSVDQSIQIVERRVNELGTVEPLIQREGQDRILVQVPGLQDPTRLKELLGKTAKLDFRMVDLTVPPDQEFDRAKDPLCHQEAGRGLRRRSDRRPAGLRPALGRADRQLPLQHQRLAQIRAGYFGECRAAVCDRAR
jgi:preprotein translocase subunit SecD